MELWKNSTVFCLIMVYTGEETTILSIFWCHNDFMMKKKTTSFLIPKSVRSVWIRSPSAFVKPHSVSQGVRQWSWGGFYSLCTTGVLWKFLCMCVYASFLEFSIKFLEQSITNSKKVEKWDIVTELCEMSQLNTTELRWYSGLFEMCWPTRDTYFEFSTKFNKNAFRNAFFGKSDRLSKLHP